MGMVNAYLLETLDGLVLIDAGWPNKTDAIFQAVKDPGHDPKNIRHLVLTHGHLPAFDQRRKFVCGATWHDEKR